MTFLPGAQTFGRRVLVIVVRVVVVLALIAFFAVGSFTLFYALYLHIQFSDASDPPMWAAWRSLWIVYLLALDVFWGASVAAILWPGQKRSVKLWRVLGYGSIAVGISGSVLMGVAYVQGHGRAYVELAGVVLSSGFIVWFAYVWSCRRTAARPDT